MLPPSILTLGKGEKETTTAILWPWLSGQYKDSNFGILVPFSNFIFREPT
jgi:hypothetical protein